VFIFPVLYIEEEQTVQWSKQKVQKDKQRSTKHAYKTKDRVTRTPLKSGSELRCSGRVGSSCSTSDTRRVNLVTNPVICHERGKDREVFTTSGTFVTQIFHNGQRSRGVQVLLRVPMIHTPLHKIIVDYS
jgi:hypothetical protein